MSRQIDLPQFRRFIRVACISPIIPALLLDGCASGPRPVSDAAIAEIDSTYAGLAEQHVFSGVVLIAQGDGVLLLKGYGMADGGARRAEHAGNAIRHRFDPTAA